MSLECLETYNSRDRYEEVETSYKHDFKWKIGLTDQEKTRLAKGESITKEASVEFISKDRKSKLWSLLSNRYGGVLVAKVNTRTKQLDLELKTLEIGGGYGGRWMGMSERAVATLSCSEEGLVKSGTGGGKFYEGTIMQWGRNDWKLTHLEELKNTVSLVNCDPAKSLVGKTATCSLKVVTRN